MAVEQRVASHYARPDIERAILEALAAAGLDIGALTPTDLAALEAGTIAPVEIIARAT